MKILIVLPNDTLGGAERYLMNVAKYYRSHNARIDIVLLKKRTTGNWDILKSINVKIYYTNSNREICGALNVVIHLTFNKNAIYDYIYTSHVHITGMIGILRRFGVVKTKYAIGRESTHIFDRFTGCRLIIYKSLYYLGYPGYNIIVCQTEQMKNKLLHNLPWLVNNVKVVVVPNPFVASIIIDNSNSSKGGDVVSAGRLIHEKGYDVLIKAFYKITHASTDIKLIIYGDGPERKNLQKLINDLKYENRIILAGYSKNVQEHFKTAGICVVSSRIEGFPNVLLEMMANNTKVVSTKCAGDIENIEGVFKAEPGNIESLKLAIEKAIESDTTHNRRIFDEYLGKRSIDNFIDKINESIRDN